MQGMGNSDPLPFILSSFPEAGQYSGSCGQSPLGTLYLSGFQSVWGNPTV